MVYNALPPLLLTTLLASNMAQFLLLLLTFLEDIFSISSLSSKCLTTKEEQLTLRIYSGQNCSLDNAITSFSQKRTSVQLPLSMFVNFSNIINCLAEEDIFPLKYLNAEEQEKLFMEVHNRGPKIRRKLLIFSISIAILTFFE